MTFETQVYISIAVALAVFVLLSAVIMLRQRHRRRRSIHYFAVFILASFVGLCTGIGVHLTGTAPLDGGAISEEDLGAL